MQSVTSVQEGMLFHRLSAPGSGVDIEQIVCRSEEPVDHARFLEAFHLVCRRHEILRTSFEWLGRKQPIQIVHPDARVPATELDWSNATERDQAELLTRFLVEDRAVDFDMRSAPLMRLAMIRTGSARHVVVWTFHHILLDGRSFPIVLSEVFEAYSALTEGRPPELGPVAPFSRYLEWDRHRDHGPAEEYFRQLLTGFDSPTPLDFGFPARSAEEGDERSVEVRLSKEETDQLHAAARRFSVTPNTIFQAAWALLLGRYSGREEVVFGTTRACRTPEVEGSRDMVGLLINTIPMRISVGGEHEVQPWLSEIRRQQLDQRAHERARLDDIQRWSDVPAGTPLFGSLAVLDTATLDRRMKALGDRFASWSFEYRGQTNYPLTLAGYLDPRMAIRIEFDPDRFDVETIRRMLQHYVRLLLGLARARPDDDPGGLRMLSDEERETLLYRWNRTERPFPRDLRIHDLFEAAADESPEAVAVVLGDTSLTYGALDARANRIARRLQSLGAGPGRRVAICLERSVDLIATMLAVSKAGAAYVPLEPDHPKERIRFVLEETRAQVVVTSDALLERVEDAGADVLSLTRERAALEALPADRPKCESSPEDAAYIIYTSGSTGRPKGVVVRHRAAVNLFHWVNRTFEVGPDDRILFVTSVCFDLSVYDVFGVLGAGASLHVATREELWAPERLVEILASGTITFWDSAPAALVQLVPLLPVQSEQSRLRLVFLSGDWIPVPLPDQVRAAFPRAHVISLGGATEATIWSNFYPIGDVDLSWPSIPYGRPIDNARYYVLDRNLEPVPVGVSGDLYIGGDVLADGYHARPELTAERFIPDPHVEGGRLYKTGDLARFMPDGNLEFLGRVDAQVKIRGFRIELGEIEAVLNQHPDVSACLVDAPAVSGRDRRLVAYVVGREGADLDLMEVRSFVAAKIPDYMVPAYLVPISHIPVTTNGKVDRRALPPPIRPGPAYVAPRDDVEEAVARLFSACLGVERVGAEDDFFELGGHSILAVRLISEIATELETTLSVRAFVRARTVAGVAALLRGARPAPTSERIRPGQGEVPLTYAQERLVFIQRLDPASAAYNIPLGFRLHGEVDARLLERALTEIVNRHEPLRTSIEVTAEGDRPRIHPPFERLPLDRIDLSTVPFDRAVAERTHAFDLEAGPMMRVLLATASEREHVLLLVVHHAVFDGQSAEVFVRELLDLYESYAASAPSPLGPLPISYSDYARWERTASGTLYEDLEYWTGVLSGALPALQLASDRPRKRVFSYRGAVHKWRLSAETSRRVDQLAREREATPFMVLLAAFAVLLSRYSGQKDILIGTPVSGRDDPGVQDLIGLFLNTLVIRTDLSGDRSFASLLADVRRRVLEALDHRALPFGRLVEALNPPRDTSRTPIFQALFSFEETTRRRMKNRHFELEPIVLEQNHARTDLSLFLTNSAEGISGYFEYSTDLFDVSRIQRMADGFTALLEGVTAEPEISVSRTPVMSPVDRLRQLSAFNNNRASFDASRTVVHRFEDRARAAPDAPALFFGERMVTYGELSAQVASLARRLRGLGAGPGQPIAVFLERGPHLLVALLATLRTGGYYVPLDPDHPMERNARILEMAAPTVVIVEAGRSASLPDTGGAAVFELEPGLTSRSDVEPGPIMARPEGLAYVIFTSGSTGEPKGVEITHASLVNFLTSMAVRPGIGPSDHLLAVTTISFDIAGLELYLPLISGATVEIADAPTTADPSLLMERMKRRPPTLFQATPATFQFLIDAGWSGDANLRVLCGGESLPPELASALITRCGRLFNMYGPTETTIWSSVDEVREDDPVISIGRPIHNTEMYVLGENLEPVPQGVAGELYIGGAGVARGYHRRPGLTAERFLPDPFSKAPQARLYRTGDLARRLPDGRFQHLGRVDYQVKLRGFRIELGEIEVAMERHPRVERAVAHVWEPAPGDRRLVGYVQTASGSRRVPSDLLAHLREHLPKYMIPAAVVALPSFPLTPNGKIDRNALPTPTVERDDPEARVARRDDVDVKIASVWERLLGVDDPGQRDDFFVLGGHSLLAVRMISELERAFRVEISLAAFFEDPTVEGLGRLIREGGGALDASVLPLMHGDSGTPLYFICGIHLYHTLARELGPEQRSYGIFIPAEQRFVEERDLVKEGVPTVEALARSYVETLLGHDPRGPYALAGISFGGVLAFEMARQLTRMGRKVETLIIIDAVLPSAMRRNRQKWVANQLVELRRSGITGLAGRVKRKLTGRVDPTAPVSDLEELDLRRREVYRAAATAYDAKPAKYHGRTIMIRASDSQISGYDIDPELGWGDRITSGLRVYEVPGDHLGVLSRPEVSITAEILRRELRAARRPRSSSSV